MKDLTVFHETVNNINLNKLLKHGQTFQKQCFGISFTFVDLLSLSLA